MRRTAACRACISRGAGAACRAGSWSAGRSSTRGRSAGSTPASAGSSATCSNGCWGISRDEDGERIVRQRTVNRILAALVLAVAVVPQAGAQPTPGAQPSGRSSPPRESNPDSALARALERIEGTPIPLEQAMRLALENATQAREARAALRAASGALRKEKGAFDPEIFADASRSREQRPVASPFISATSIDNDFASTRNGASIKLPFGTKIEASVDTKK